MKYQYGKYEGVPFPGPDDLFAAPQPIVQFILQYGQQALDAMNNLDDEQQHLIAEMLQAGLLERQDDGTLSLTPRMVRAMQHRALLDMLQALHTGRREGHETSSPGRSDERTEGTRSYAFGDKLSDLDLGATLRQAIQRSDPEPGVSPLPIKLHSYDFQLHVTEGQSDLAVCLLIDMSGSMMRWGRFYQAKRVALGMAELLRTRFSQDTIDYVGFHSLAEVIAERDLPLLMPKLISTREFEVRVRVPLAQARQEPTSTPQHFTNLQLGLRLARQVLSRRGAANKVIFIITDGQPTAHVEINSDAETSQEMLYLLYPPQERTSTITLKEALRCRQENITLTTFALVEDYWGMDWVDFVDQLTRLTRGTACYCASDDLSSLVIESYLSGRRQRSVS